MDMKECARCRVAITNCIRGVDSVALDRCDSHVSTHRIVFAFEKLLERSDP